VSDTSQTTSQDAQWALQIIRRLADVVFVLGLDGTVEWRRELRPGATGADDASLVGTQMLARTHPDEMGLVVAAFDDLVAGRKEQVEIDVRVRSARDDDSWTLNHVLAVRMPDGRIAGLSRILDDHLEVSLTEPGAPGFSLAEVAPVGIALLGLADLVVYTNQAFREATGLEPGLLPTADPLAALIANATTIARSAGSHRFEAEGNGRSLAIQTHRVGSAGRPEVLVTVQDVTELTSLRAAQRRSDTLFSTAFEHAPTGMALVGLNNEFLRVNPAFAEITGYDEDELLTLGFPAITHPDDLEADLRLAQQVLDGTIPSYRIDKRYLHKDGHSVWVELRVAGAYDESGKLTNFVSQITDITSRRFVEEQQRANEAILIHRATHDPLTDLPNRSLLDEHLRLMVARVRRESDSGAVLVCDLDGFKAVNDTYGHLLGDRVLTTIASRLLATVRETDLVARVGGDEFVVALASAHHPDGILAVAERIYEALCQPIDDPEFGAITIGASIGVTDITADDDPTSAIHRADGLAYRAKRAGGGIEHEGSAPPS
jgi:diguanylate cyclase (GGDEF)-like protein/PAS domain S-box-containing protein